MDSNNISEKLRYPVGKFSAPDVITDDLLQDWIHRIERFPYRLRELVEPLSEEEMNWRYRPGGWTIRQVVHHCADSHMNAFMRFKLALTEDTPSIKPYFEDRWAETPDILGSDVENSLLILQGVHTRWAILVHSLKPEELKKQYFHPQRGIKVVLDENTGFYAWHSDHHLAHVRQAINARGNFES
jgi:hypothetical protein